MASRLLAIPRAIAKIFGGLFLGIKDTFTRLRELREIRRIEKQRTIDVKYPDDSNIIHVTQGKLSQDMEWVYLPLFKRIQQVGTIYKDEKLKPVIHTSLRTHKTLDLSELNELTLEFYVNAKKEIMSFGKNKLKHTDVTTDLSIKDNPISQEFSIDADRVFATKSLEILEEPARRTLMVMMLFGICIGMIISFFVAYMLLLWLG